MLQEGEIERLGGTQTVKVDVRLVAATNKDLADARWPRAASARTSTTGSTWSRSACPRCASRREDIPLLADHFLRRFAAKNGKTVRGFSPRRSAALEDYAWPGNVRELEHAVERAVVLARGDVLDAGDLPETVRKGPLRLGRPAGHPHRHAAWRRSSGG